MSSHKQAFQERERQRKKAAADERAARARARKQARQVKAHKRRVAGKIVHVKAYCRRKRRSNAQVNREMPF